FRLAGRGIGFENRLRRDGQVARRNEPRVGPADPDERRGNGAGGPYLAPTRNWVIICRLSKTREAWPLIGSILKAGRYVLLGFALLTPTYIGQLRRQQKETSCARSWS